MSPIDSALDTLAAAAAARRLTVDLVERGPASSLEEAAALLGIGAHNLVKSMLVRSKDGYLFALVPGDRQIAWPKLRAVVGVNKLVLPPADEAYEACGYERGTVTPVGARGDWPVYVDERVQGERIALGSGTHTHSLLVETDDLVRAYEATVADISK
ncbi:aminoacyl-tRNA deacylase [Propionibacteriaceae bacterium Y1685]|uniref:aminoacyl-tRNA deacylase n=1 Tax=Microlunatus sp. Y1700 TaxID=3418487 RepID=UPI003B7E4B2D